MALAITDWMLREGFTPDTVAFEWPQIYQRHGSKSKGDPNDLPGLAGVGMAVAGLLGVEPYPVDVRTFVASEWKGQLPKHVCEHHIKRTLTASESKILPLFSQHDTIDAIGIGLHALGRMALSTSRHRVLPGAVE